MNEQKRDALAEALCRHDPESYLPGSLEDSAYYARFADALLPLVDTWLAEAEQRVTDAVEAALRLIAPDHITPMGARQIRAAMENVTTRGNR